jgi:hypothetical protein
VSKQQFQSKLKKILLQKVGDCAGDVRGKHEVNIDFTSYCYLKIPSRAYIHSIEHFTNLYIISVRVFSVTTLFYPWDLLDRFLRLSCHVKSYDLTHLRIVLKHVISSLAFDLFLEGALNLTNIL